ncbi:MAG: C40 family peptidase [Methylococcaceae bacterium]|nr:C40 family peptidase [Methylococcaceae bacterium]
MTAAKRPWMSDGMIRHWALLAAVLLLSGCASTPELAKSRAGAEGIVDYALSLQGAPYHYGKASPEEGFDCSGFVWHVYRRSGVALPRTTEQMALALPEVDIDERQPSDLLFFQTGEKSFSHVGIYIGNEAFVHAPSSNTGRVMVSRLEQDYWWRRFVGVRRPGLNARSSAGG